MSIAISLFVYNSNLVIAVKNNAMKLKLAMD